MKKLFIALLILLVTPISAFAASPSVTINVPAIGCDPQTLTITGKGHINPSGAFDFTDYLEVKSNGTVKVSQAVTTVSEVDRNFSFSDTYGTTTPNEIVATIYDDAAKTQVIVTKTETFSIADCSVVPPVVPPVVTPVGSNNSGEPIEIGRSAAPRYYVNYIPNLTPAQRKFYIDNFPKYKKEIMQLWRNAKCQKLGIYCAK